MKKPVTTPVSVAADTGLTLSEEQAVTLFALANERARALAQAQKVTTSILALARMIAKTSGLPDGEYDFEKRGDEIVLVLPPPAQRPGHEKG